MTLYDAAVRALLHGKGIRRPSMPPGMTIVPVLSGEGEVMKAFMVFPNASGSFPDWNAGVEDLVAQDWHVAHWKPHLAGADQSRCG